MHLPGSRQSEGPSGDRRSGMTHVEVIVVVLISMLLLGLLFPWVQRVREASRRNTCSAHMGNLARALIAYEQRHGHFPPAATWDTSSLQSLALHESRRWDLFVGSNWAIELLPDLGRSDLYHVFDSEVSIASEHNRMFRETLVAEMTCPSDEFNHSGNRFRFEPVEGLALEFARGNYAVNAGTHSFFVSEGSSKSPTGDHAHVRMDVKQRQFEYWGNGIAGFNKSFRRSDIANGSSTLIALNEIRAGIDPMDIRGCWALGHIAASATWGHGINGDAYGPNNSWARSDDIQGGPALNEKYGPLKLVALGMPCVSYIDKNQNAASRSRHRGGVNAAFLDGAVRFISDDIDPSLWHALHSRETPSEILVGEPENLISWSGSKTEAPPPPSGEITAAQERLRNSLGMEFVRIPSGKFMMGIPDQGNNVDTPPETPAHPVQITNDYWLGSTEVTKMQFQAVMEGSESAAEGDSDMPAVDVTWYEAVRFCQKLSERPEEQMAGRSYRLPTEAEWEYACRQCTSTAYVWRSTRPPGHSSGEAAGINPALPIGAVASFPCNSLGLYDMRGNAWEWCSDWFDRDYYARSRKDDPAGPESGYSKVVRGGDWIYVGEQCFINYPILAPWKSSPVVGFRVVCVQRP